MTPKCWNVDTSVLTRENEFIQLWSCQTVQQHVWRECCSVLSLQCAAISDIYLYLVLPVSWTLLFSKSCLEYLIHTANEINSISNQHITFEFGQSSVDSTYATSKSLQSLHCGYTSLYSHFHVLQLYFSMYVPYFLLFACFAFQSVLTISWIQTDSYISVSVCCVHFHVLYLNLLWQL